MDNVKERLRCERQIGKDGLHETERQVMALFDAGAGVENIKFITGLKPALIQTIVGRLAVTAHEPWKDDARRGSSDLLKALRRHHPNRCGAAS